MTMTTCVPMPGLIPYLCASEDSDLGLVDTFKRQKKALNLAQVAELLNVSRGKIYSLVEGGRIPHFRLGATIRFDPKAVAAWLDGKTVD